MDPANPYCPLFSPFTFFGECPKSLSRPSQLGPPMHFTAKPCLTPGPCAGETCGAEDNENQAGPWEASAQAVSRMALRHASAPCPPSTTRPSYSVHVASPGAGDSQTSENQDIFREDNGWNGGDSHSQRAQREVGRELWWTACRRQRLRRDRDGP